MVPLDDAQRREVARRRAEQPAWARSRPRRVGLALVLSVVAAAEGSVIGMIDSEVDPLVPALAFGLLALAFGLVLALMDQDKRRELAVRSNLPSAATFHRGDIAFQRDGGRIPDEKPKDAYWPE